MSPPLGEQLLSSCDIPLAVTGIGLKQLRHLERHEGVISRTRFACGPDQVQTLRRPILKPQDIALNCQKFRVPRIPGELLIQNLLNGSPVALLLRPPQLPANCQSEHNRGNTRNVRHLRELFHRDVFPTNLQVGFRQDQSSLDPGGIPGNCPSQGADGLIGILQSLVALNQRPVENSHDIRHIRQPNAQLLEPYRRLGPFPVNQESPSLNELNQRWKRIQLANLFDQASDLGTQLLLSLPFLLRKLWISQVSRFNEAIDQTPVGEKINPQ